jgi:hypothetical protein
LSEIGASSLINYIILYRFDNAEVGPQRMNINKMNDLSRIPSWHHLCLGYCV